MRKQPKRHALPMIRLHLEAFERRDLLSAIQLLVNSCLPASSLSAPVVVQTHDLAGGSLTAGTATLNSSTDPTTSSSQAGEVQPQTTGTNSAVPVGTGSIGPADGDSVSTPTLVGLPITTVPVTSIGSSTPSKSNTVETSVAAGASVELSGSVPVVAELVDFGTLTPSDTLSMNTSTSSQSGTAGGQSNPTLEGNSSTPAVAEDNGESQASGSATVQTSGTGDSYVPGNDISEPSSVAQLPSAASAAVSPTETVTANTGSGIGLNGSEQYSPPSSGSTIVVSAPSGPASTGVLAYAEGKSTRSTASGSRPTSSASLTSSPVSPRGRGDDEITAPPLATVPGLLSNEAPPLASTPGVDHVGSGSEDAAVADHASSHADLKSLVISGVRSTASLDVFSTDLVFAERAQLGQDKPKTHDSEQPQAEEPVVVLCVGEMEAGAGSLRARGAGLLGSPLPFDVDTLAREAQQFYQQIDQLSQSLVNLLARMDLPSWSVAVAVAATAAAVVRRRLQQNQRSLVLNSCAVTAFACYPGLGGSWSWEESCHS